MPPVYYFIYSRAASYRLRPTGRLTRLYIRMNLTYNGDAESRRLPAAASCFYLAYQNIVSQRLTMPLGRKLSRISILRALYNLMMS